MNLVTKYRKQALAILEGNVVVNRLSTKFSGIMCPRNENGDMIVIQYEQGAPIGIVLVSNENYLDFCRAIMTAVPAPKRGTIIDKS